MNYTPTYSELRLLERNYSIKDLGFINGDIYSQDFDDTYDLILIFVNGCHRLTYMQRKVRLINLRAYNNTCDPVNTLDELSPLNVWWSGISVRLLWRDGKTFNVDEYEVSSSQGTLMCDNNGMVLECVLDSPTTNNYITGIKQFNLAEYKAFWGEGISLDEIDILDLSGLNYDGTMFSADYDFRSSVLIESSIPKWLKDS